MTNPAYDALANETPEGPTESEAELYSDPRGDDERTQDENLDAPDPA
jgi:hypothetical protein